MKQQAAIPVRVNNKGLRSDAPAMTRARKGWWRDGAFIMHPPIMGASNARKVFVMFVINISHAPIIGKK